jgi:uncharacterized membrane protein required for colicin V production
MTIWILALLLLASLAGLGYRQGAIRVAFSLVGILLGALLASPLSGAVKPLVAICGVKSPVLLWLIPPLVVFVIIMVIFKVAALVVHQKVEVHYKYNTGDLLQALWERLNRRVGLCLGLVNGAAYFILLVGAVYPLGYWTYQMAMPESDPKSVRLVNRLGEDLQATGMAKVARALDKNPPEFYAAADVVGLIYRHPLLEARLSRYPAFLGLAERPEFQDLGSDAEFAGLRLKQASVAELLNYPKVQAMLQNPDLQKTIKDTVIPNLGDLQSFLTNGVSARFDEKILGRWDFDLNSSMLLMRRAKPNLPATEMRKWKGWLASNFSRATFVATTEQQAFLKNMPRFTAGATPGDLQRMEGQWKSNGGNYALNVTSDGKALEMTAHISGDQLTVSGPGMDIVFIRED